MSDSNYRDMVIGMLADSEATAWAFVAELEAERDGYRSLACATIDLLHIALVHHHRFEAVVSQLQRRRYETTRAFIAELFQSAEAA